MIFGDGMRAMRGLRKVTQMRLAREVGVSFATISRAEGGKQRLQDDVKSRIRIALTWPETIDPLLERIQTAHYEA